MWSFSRDTTVSVTQAVCATVGIVGTLYVADRVRRTGRRAKFLPPGPPTSPLVGNLTSIFPAENVWFKFTEWTRQYGEIYSLKLGSSNVVILGSVAAVKEIIGKNSVLIRERPRSALMDSVLGGRSSSWAHYSQGWQMLRKRAREILTFQMDNQHLEVQHAEATQLMFDMLSEPTGFYHQIRRYAASTALSVVFGKRTPQPTTPEVAEFFAVQRNLELLAEPGAVRPIDLVPILRRFSEGWARWKELANQTRHLEESLYFKLYEEVITNVNAGEKNGCWMETIVERGPEAGLDEIQMAYLGGMLIEDGSDTTCGLLRTLVFVLMNWPEAQKKAQEEIDMVVGPDRTPMVQDIDDLPYVQALIKETHRWRPIAPLALPHATTEDLPYKEYIIPQESVIYVDNWSTMHDQDAFGDPEAFRPERWFKPELWDERTFDLMFGIGGGICPGQHVTRDSINLNAMNFLWAFNISRAKDISGREKTYDLDDFARGLLTAPNTFECVITPRSGGRADMIRHEFLNATTHFERFERVLNPDDREHLTKLRQQVKASLV